MRQAELKLLSDGERAGADNIPKRHHFVPEMLSKRFVDSDGKLYCYKKDAPERGVFTGTPKNLFVQGHLYTAFNEDGTKDVLLEQKFSQLDSEANDIIEKIIVSVRKGQLPGLTEVEKRVWDLFHFVQWKRVPDSHGFYFTDENFGPVIQQAKADYQEKYGPLTEEQEGWFQDPEWLKKYKQNVRVGMLAQAGSRVREALSQKGLGIAIISKPNKSFVIGSFPVVKFAHTGRADLTDSTVEVWLPISHDVAVTPAPISPMKEKAVYIRDSDVRKINEAILKQSTMIAGRSPKLIRSLTGDRGRCFI